MEVELGEGGLGHLGGDLLGLVQVAGAYREVVDGHYADELLAVGDRQAADVVSRLTGSSKNALYRGTL